VDSPPPIAKIEGMIRNKLEQSLAQQCVCEHTRSAVSKIVKVEKGKSHGSCNLRALTLSEGVHRLVSQPPLVHVLAAGEVERTLFPGRIDCKDVLRGVDVSVAECT
jgi:hypothetical protein